MKRIRPGGPALRTAALLLLLAGLLGWRHHVRVAEVRAVHWREGERHAVQEPQLLMTFPEELHESSGVAASRRTPGLFWTHNDSGGDAVVYGVDPDVGVVARLVLAGAPHRDWEDIDLGPCPPPSTGPCLYVGDIGDNLGRRSSVSVLIVEEPSWEGGFPPGPGDGSPVVLDVPWRRVDVAYPGGARDAEALAVTEEGTLYIVSKGAGGSHDVYALGPADLAAGDGSLRTLEAAGALPLAPLWWVGRVVTAGTDAGPDLVVRTYTEVYHFRRDGDGWVSTRAPCFVAGLGDGGEGLDVSADGELYLTREAGRDRPAALQAARCADEEAGAEGTLLQIRTPRS